MSMLSIHIVNNISDYLKVVSRGSVWEYVFYVFFRFQKNMTFYVFLKWRFKKS